MDLGFAGATVVVQGGSRGMGLAAAECFAADGAKVAVLARSEKSLGKAAARLAELGAADTLELQADITDDAQVQAAFAKVGERWGTLNVLVNAAGPVDKLKTVDDLTDQDWFDTFDVGALGMVRCVRAALPLLRAARADGQWARIVNVSAHSTKRQSPTLIAYTAAKSAVTSITKNLSLTLAEEEILVNTVSPGSFASPAMQHWAKSLGVDHNDGHAMMELIKERYGHPAHLPRTGFPNEIGPVIAFAASPRASYMTGANINVDGGSDFT